MPTHSYMPRDGCVVPVRPHITKLYTAFEDHYESDFYFGGEVHDFWELVVVTDGAVGVTADHQVYTLRAGQAILHPPMEFHRIWAAEGTSPTVIIVSFAAQNLTEEMGCVRNLSPQNMARVYHVWELIRSGYERSRITILQPRQEMLVDAQKSVCLLEYLLMSITGDPGSVDAQDASPSAQQYRQIMEVLSNHLSEPLTISQVAELCHMSPTCLKRTFSRYAGIGVMHYFMEMKIRHSMELMRRGERISTVSEALGFENQNYFSTVFRRVVGMSPSQFRRSED